MLRTGYHGGSAMRKSLRIFAVASAISIISTMTSFANWEQVNGTWKYSENGTYLTGWQWLDGNGDNIAECYYLDGNGIMAVSTVIGGYTVDINGAWIIDGVVQTKVVGSGGSYSNSSQSVNKGKTDSENTTTNNNSGFTVPPLSSGNVGGLDWTAECGDSTGLPPME